MWQDACNGKSNQQHLGTIKSSNLCTEIIEYTAPDEVAVCNLASVALSMFVDEDAPVPSFDYARLEAVVKVMTRNLNKVLYGNACHTPPLPTSWMRIGCLCWHEWQCFQLSTVT